MEVFYIKSIQLKILFEYYEKCSKKVRQNIVNPIQRITGNACSIEIIIK